MPFSTRTPLRSRWFIFLLLGAVPLGAGCSEPEPQEPDDDGVEFVTEVSAEFGPEGGELIAPDNSGFAGFSIKIPPGALESKVKISFAGVVDDTDLPDTAERVGAQISIEPAGTTLKIPAELTLPLDLERLGHFSSLPEDCKVWARSGAGWEKIEALSHTDASVTIPISTLTTAAAGVNFLPTKTCASCTQIPSCESVSNDYCITKLPRPSNMHFMDDFASLRIVGSKVYWGARVEEEPAVLRYDLSNPGDAFVYPTYPGPSSGSISTKGRVAVKSESEVWLTFNGYGNLRFRSENDPELYDSLKGVGVMANPTQVTRFVTKQAAGSSIRDIEMVMETGTTRKFLYRYNSVPNSNGTLPHDNVTAQGVRDDFTLRSAYRGKAHGFYPGGAVSLSGFWGYEDTTGGAGTSQIYFHPTSFGAFLGTRTAESVDRELTMHTGFFDAEVNVTLPSAVRDGTYLGADLVSITADHEIFITTSTGGTTTIALPDEGPMTPLRVEALPDNSAVLLVTRGPLVAKGEFYLLKRKP